MQQSRFNIVMRFGCIFSHEITLLKIKHIRLKEEYGGGEIPFESKTGTRLYH